MKRILTTASPYLFSTLVLFFLGGVACGSIHFLTETQLLTLLIYFFPLLVLCFTCKWEELFLVLALLCTFLLGSYHSTPTFNLPDDPDHIVNLVKTRTDSVLIGRVKSIPIVNERTSSITFEPTYWQEKGYTVFSACRGTIHLNFNFPWPPEYEPGDFLAVRTVLKRPDGINSPGSFDYPAYLARQGIFITGSVRSPAQLARVDAPKFNLSTLRFFPEKLRMRAGRFIDTHLANGNDRALYRTLLLGDRSSLSDDIYEKYKASGLAHILAVSGLHVSILGSLLFIILYWLLRRSEYFTLRWNARKSALLCTLPLLCTYALLAGMGSPVLRATVMAALVIIALCSNRMKSMANILALAALVLVVPSPQRLFTVSFLLSFTAIGALLLYVPLLGWLYNWFDRLPVNPWQTPLIIAAKWISLGLCTSTVAVLGTMPLVVYHFHRLPLAGPLATLLVEPLICLWTLPLGFLGLVSIPISPEFGALSLKAGAFTISFANTVADFFSSIPSLCLWLPQPQLSLIVVYYFTLLLIPAAVSRGKRSTCTAVLLFFFTLILILVPQLTRPPSHDETRVTFLDVGQGSSTLLEIRDGTTIMIDGGGSSYPAPTTGERVLAPYLWKKRKTRIEGIILTHPDSDHYNGLPFIIRRFRPKFIWTSTDLAKDPGYRDLLHLCKKEGVDIHIAASGDTLRYKDAVVTCLINTLQEEVPERNNGLVIKLEINDLAILLPGDIESETEQGLVKRGIPLKSTILLAAHHGSSTSNTPDFLDVVSPQLIIVSAGKSKRKSYPSTQLIMEGKNRGIPILSTHKAGALQLRSANGKHELYSSTGEDRNPLHRNRMTRTTVQLSPDEYPGTEQARN